MTIRHSLVLFFRPVFVITKRCFSSYQWGSNVVLEYGICMYEELFDNGENWNNLSNYYSNIFYAPFK
jgi:hypothetical protein